MISNSEQSLTSELNSRRRIEVSKSNPCPHCGGIKWCYRLSDNISVCKHEVNPATGWYKTGQRDKEDSFYYATEESKEAWKKQNLGKNKGKPTSEVKYRYQLVKPSETGFLSHLQKGTLDISEEEVFVCRKDYQDGTKSIFQGSKTSPDAKAVWTVPSEWRPRILPYRLMESFGGFTPWQDIPTEVLLQHNWNVFIPEGEKCVDAIIKRKGLAFCNYGGGGHGKWKESDTQYFIDLFRWYKGKERPLWQEIVPQVVLMPDRDKPGLDHSLRIFKSLTKAGYPENKIRWYFSFLAKGWDDIPHAHGLDIADMFDENPQMTVEDILRSLKTTEECPWLERYFQPVDESNIALDDDLAFCRFYVDEVTTDIDWLIQDILPSGYSVVLSGQSGSGKSVSAFDLAAAVAKGGTWMDKEASQGKVLILNNDQSEMVLKRMLKTRIGSEDILLDNIAVKHGFVADDEGLEKLRKWVEKYDFSLVIMDSVRECICHPLGISQNDAESGYRLKRVAEVVTSLSGCFVAIHHENKSKDSSGVEKASGSTSIISNVDAHWRITKGATGNNKLLMPKTRGYSPVEVDYQIDFNTGICNATAPFEDSQQSTGNNPTIGERVVAYLEEEASEDGTTAKEIAEALEVKERSLREILRRLMNDGIIESASVEGSKVKRYSLVKDDE